VLKKEEVEEDVEEDEEEAAYTHFVGVLKLLHMLH
jgi:hypothetical protein